MTTTRDELTEKLKKRLCDSIGAQVDQIGHVPQDVARMVGEFRFEAEALGQSPEDVESVRAHEAAPGIDRDRLASNVNHFYDRAFYSRDGLMGMLLGETEYRNIGYWDETTRNQQQASERLQDALLAFIPEKKGRILDVACGMGASTKRLLRHYPADDVWAINISARQIESTRRNAPGCHAQVMNAVDLKFDDGFFDAIECIEAAFHFETRRRFLEESLRVLGSGGQLVLSDTLFTSRERLAQYPIFPGPENHLADAGEYRALLADVGFRDIRIDDVSREVWGAHFLHVVNRIHEEFLARRLNIVHLTDILWTYYHLDAITGACLFVSARKG